jgi:hypothetical protein
MKVDRNQLDLVQRAAVVMLILAIVAMALYIT